MEDVKAPRRTANDVLLDHLKAAWEREAELDAELATVRKFMSSTTEWLKLNGVPVPERPERAQQAAAAAQRRQPPRTPLPGLVQPEEAKRNAPEPKGNTSVRQAVERVLRTSGGRSMHAREILAEVQKLGGRTDAADPIAIIDLHVYNLKKSGLPVERTAARTWKWAG